MSNEGQHGRSPNARLQDRIILYLGEHEDVDTVSGLSRVLESPRSSTSRAMNQLKRDGLVHRVEGRWALTSEGQKEEATLRPRIRKRSERANKEIRRLERLQREWDRTVGSRAAQQAMKNQAFIREAMRSREAISSRSAIEEAMQAHSTIRQTVDGQAVMQEVDGRAVMQEVMNAKSVLREAHEARSLIFQADAQVRPFLETMRLVDSVGVGNPDISSALKTVSTSIQANQAAYAESISKAAAEVSNLAPTTLESLSDTINLITRKLGESAFASVQVRAVEDLLKQITPSDISPNTLDAFASQVEIASGPIVRHILEQADVRTLLDEEAAVPGTESGTLGEASTSTLKETDSALQLQTWDELPERVKLRYVAVITFIILHLALIAAQKQPDDSEYVMDLLHGAEGTAAVVAVCNQLGLFKDED